MVALVTTEEAVAHLRLDINPGSDSDDVSGQAEILADLELKIDTASEIVMDYLKRSESIWEDPATVPRPIHAAVLLLLSDLWEKRGGDVGGDYIEPEGPIARLLVRYRDPALA